MYSFIYSFSVEEVDHWAFGPHHAWTKPETGDILRMWQPFNGLQIYPGGVGKSPQVDVMGYVIQKKNEKEEKENNQKIRKTKVFFFDT